MGEKIKQEYLFSTRDGSRYFIGISEDNQKRGWEEPYTLLVLEVSSHLQAIIDISKQMNQTGESVIIQNPIIVQIFKDSAVKSNKEFNEEVIWDDQEEPNSKDRN